MTGDRRAKGSQVPDPIFAHPRLAAIYDVVDDDRSDLDVYAALVEELGAGSVLDIGCGTGTFACLLARRGVEVVGLDPASASLEVARGKPGADRVRWVHGDVTCLPDLAVDVVSMTGNVAQVFLTDTDWAGALTAARRMLRPGGRLVFETRDPARRAWEGWTRDTTYRALDIPAVGRVETWIDLVRVDLPYVSFRHTYRFGADGAELTSDSTLRFRDRDEITGTLDAVGFRVEEVRGAPDRPGANSCSSPHADPLSARLSCQGRRPSGMRGVGLRGVSGRPRDGGSGRLRGVDRTVRRVCGDGDQCRDRGPGGPVVAGGVRRARRPRRGCAGGRCRVRAGPGGGVPGGPRARCRRG